MSVVCIGIPAYSTVSAETLEDYMRFAYYCGRRMPGHEFLLAIKSKSEQFRARNAIVEAAIQTGCDYLMFLDDDHVIDWEGVPTPNARYGFLQTLIDHMESDPQMGIVGGLYFHRGAQCRPVLMKEGKDGGFYWMRDDEIKGELQEVAVQGGGCMLLRLSMFDRIKSPWFEPEFDMGTDLQICQKARAAGFKVACDTSIQIGHVLAKREVVTPQNRHRIAAENAKQVSGGEEGIQREWQVASALRLYREDAEEYMGMKFDTMSQIACRYDAAAIKKHEGNLAQYYATRGNEQLARQVLFHHTEAAIQQSEMWWNMINTQAEGYGLDFGCGSAPVGFEVAMRGHKMDFVDVDGSAAYEFTKWRARKRGIDAGFQLAGPYDYILFLDSIEHLEDPGMVFEDILPRLKQNGAVITNYFLNRDYENPEHISMNKELVKTLFIKHGIYPLTDLLLVKQDLGHMDREKNDERSAAA